MTDTNETAPNDIEDLDLDEIDELISEVETGETRMRGSGTGNARTQSEPQPELGGGTDAIPLNRFCQWTSPDKKIYIPAVASCGKLTPGMYEIRHSDAFGIHFVKIELSTEDLIRFNDSNIEAVLKEITTFWNAEERYNTYRLPHKRGILMWGPQGTGKTCATQLVMEDVIKRGGIIIKFGLPGFFNIGFRLLREIQPETPVVTVMEDLDELVQMHSESEITNILDGTAKTEKIVFLATTNYPRDLGARIVNRPSRFDRIFKIGNLSSENRRIYLEHLLAKGNLTAREANIDMEKWVEQTQDLSISHIKELFISVVIFGSEYEKVIKRLRKMSDELKDQEPAGFAVSGKT